MSAPILVAGSFQKWDCVVSFVLGTAGILGGIASWGAITPWDFFLVGGGAIALLAGVAVLTRRTLHRRWVVIESDGFVWQDRQGETEINDDDIFAMSLASKQNFSNGEYRSTTRKFTVWAELQDEARPITMTSTLFPNAPDPLAPLVERIANKLRDEASETLAGGHRVEGKGWALERDSLHVVRSRESERIPFSDLAAAEIYDGHVCVWRKGQEDPAARIPESGENAWVLLLLLQKHIAQQKPSDEPAAGLGRILFERKPSRIWAWIAMPLAVFCLLAGALLIVAAVATRKGEPLIAAMVALPLGAALLLAAIASRRQVFRCHEYGVHCVRWMRERRLKYIDVASFTSQATRIYVNGAYSGTQVVLRFDPLPELDAKPIKYSATVKNADAALDMLRDHVARVVANRLARELSSGKTVAWGPNLTFETQGFRYRPSGFLGRKEAVFLPYADMSRYQLDQGKFQLWMQGEKKPTVNESAATPNFFPGYFLFLMLISPSETEAAAADSEAAEISQFEETE